MNTKYFKTKKLHYVVLLLLSVSLYAVEPYNRKYFGDGWATYSGCTSVREHVLITYSVTPPVMKDKCTLLSGTWVPPWENKTYYVPSKLDVDHTVPLKWAYDHGAHAWTQQQRVQYANNYVDKHHLTPLSAHENRSKSDSGPDKWLPRYNRCEYVRTFVRVVEKYKLQFTEQENKVVRTLLQVECNTQRTTR